MSSPQNSADLARARIDEPRRAANLGRSAHRRPQTRHPTATHESVTLRFGSLGDERSLARLAALDSADALGEPTLLAEIDGQLLAALSLSHGSVIADPFHRTDYLVDLLRARARQLNRHSRMSYRGRLLAWARLCPPTPAQR